jgi:hypothetical protein
MRDFLLFLRYLFRIIHFARGILLSLGLLLLICVLVFSRAEGVAFREGVYFVLITALTIGYGDITPETAWGRIASVAAGVIGVLITGMVIAAAVRALGQALQIKGGDPTRREDPPR